MNVGDVVCTVAPDGREFRLRFDGWQEMWQKPAEPQFTALEEIPGLVTIHSTTYGRTVANRGFTVPEFQLGTAAL